MIIQRVRLSGKTENIPSCIIPEQQLDWISYNDYIKGISYTPIKKVNIVKEKEKKISKKRVKYISLKNELCWDIDDFQHVFNSPKTYNIFKMLNEIIFPGISEQYNNQSYTLDKDGNLIFNINLDSSYYNMIICNDFLSLFSLNFIENNYDWPEISRIYNKIILSKHNNYITLNINIKPLEKDENSILYHMFQSTNNFLNYLPNYFEQIERINDLLSNMDIRALENETGIITENELIEISDTKRNRLVYK